MSATDHADEALHNKMETNDRVLLTAKRRATPRVPLPQPFSGWMPGCLPLHLHRPRSLPLHILLLHGDVKLVVDARVLLVEDDLGDESIWADWGGGGIKMRRNQHLEHPGKAFMGHKVVTILVDQRQVYR